MDRWARRASRAGDEVYVRARDMAECRVLCYGVTTSARTGEQASSGLHMRACVSLSAASAWPGRRVLVRERQVARTRKDLDPAGRLARSSIARRGIKRSWLVLVGLIFFFVVRSARTMPVKS